MKSNRTLSSKDINVAPSSGRRSSGDKRAGGSGIEESSDATKKARMFVPEQCAEEGHFHVVLGDSLPSMPRYKILDLMGEGTFAKVCEIWDRQTKTYFACKIVRAIPKYARDAEMEYTILRRVRSWDPDDKFAFVKPLGSFRIPARPSLSNQGGSEHVCIMFPRMGCSLLDWIMFHGTIPAAPLAGIVHQLCSVLQFLHARRQIHTDLKPENLLFEKWDEEERGNRKFQQVVPMRPKSWRIRVIDFGGCADDRHSHGAIVSTRHYRAPEVILGQGWMYGADMWSVGCIIFELFSGRVLFDTHHNAEHLMQMSVALGAFPEGFARGCNDECRPYFRSDGSTIRWPEVAPNDKSAKRIDDCIPASEPELRDFIRRCLDYNKTTRMTAHDALTHPFVTKYNGKYVE